MNQRRHNDLLALGAIAAAGPHGASALAIARAVLYRRAQRVPLADQERLGLGVAAGLTRRGLVTPTLFNRFKLAQQLETLGRILPK